MEIFDDITLFCVELRAASILLLLFMTCSFTSLVTQYCVKKRAKKGQNFKKIDSKKESSGCCGCLRKKATTRGKRKKIRSPSKTSRRSEGIRPGRANKDDYQTFDNLDIDIFKKMEINKKHSKAVKSPLGVESSKDVKPKATPESVIGAQEEDAPKTASPLSLEESPSDQPAEISDESQIEPSEIGTPSPLKGSRSFKESSPSKVPDAPVIGATKTAKTKDDVETKLAKPNRIKQSSSENKREKQKMLKLLEQKINAVLKEDRSRDEKKVITKKSVEEKDKQQNKEMEYSNKATNKDKKKEMKSRGNDKQNSESNSERSKETEDDKSTTDKISVMQPIMLDSEIESGMTMSVTTEKSTVEAKDKSEMK